MAEADEDRVMIYQDGGWVSVSSANGSSG